MGTALGGRTAILMQQQFRISGMVLLLAVWYGFL
jgi:hypothetical protein